MPNENITDKNQTLSWNSDLNSNDLDYVLLPEGDYPFTVLKFVPEKFPGNEKMCACDKAVLTLKVESENGITIIHDNLILHKLMEWKLSQFFRSIGQKKKGERMVMNWKTVPGSSGMAHIKVERYVNSFGNEKVINKIDKYLDCN